MRDNEDFNEIIQSDDFSDILDSILSEYSQKEGPEEEYKPYTEFESESEDYYEPEAEKEISDGGFEEEFNPGFNIDRRADGSPRTFSYGGRRVSSSQELDYKLSQPEYSELSSSYGEKDDYDLGVKYGIEEKEAAPTKKELKKLRREQLKDDDKAGKKKLSKEEKKAVKAQKKQRRMRSDEEYEGAFDKEDSYIPGPTFKEYLSSRVAAVVLKLRGEVPTGSQPGSAYAESEFLGEELGMLEASKYYGSQVYSLRLRTRFAIILTLISIYLSSGLPAPGMLSNFRVAVAANVLIEFAVMIMGLDVLTNGVMNALRKKFGADSMAVLCAVFTVADALMLLNNVGVSSHIPFCPVASLIICGMLLSSLASARAMRKALRVPAIGKKKYSVTTELNVVGKEITALKSERPITGFLRRMEEAPVDETMYQKLSLPIVLFAVFLALIVMIVKRSYSRIIYIISILLCSAVPFTALLGFALPYFMGSIKIFGNGAALAGWSGICDLGHSNNIIVTDRDLFPEENIEIENVRIFADYDSIKVITYAASLIDAAGCGLTPVFDALLAENSCEKVKVDNLEFLAGGGIKGMAEGHVIIAGSADLMRLMNIRLPYRLVSQTCVLLSIDGVLYGIFNIKYKADPHVRKALVALMRSSRHPIFAIRDFNITPEMIKEHFDVATDGYDFPPYVDRFRISEAKPSMDSQISGVVCREGLGPLTDLADTARKIYNVTKICVLISLLSSVGGMLFSFIRLMSTGAVSVSQLLLIQLIVNLPVILLGIAVNTFE